MRNKFSFKSPTGHNETLAAVIFGLLLFALLVLCQSCDNKPTKIQVDKYMALYKIGYANGVNSMFTANDNIQLDSIQNSDTISFRKFLENGNK